MFFTLAAGTRVEDLTVTSPADEISANVVPHPLAQYFIYLLGGRVSYSFGGQLLSTKVTVDWRAI